MALINCPECKKEISDKATSCPNCGFPLQLDKTSLENNSPREEGLLSDLSVARPLDKDLFQCGLRGNDMQPAKPHESITDDQGMRVIPAKIIQTPIEDSPEQITNTASPHPNNRTIYLIRGMVSLVPILFILAVFMFEPGATKFPENTNESGGRSPNVVSPVPKPERYSWAQYLTKTECDGWGTKGAGYGASDRLAGNYDSGGKKRMATSDISLSDNRLSEIWTCFETGYDTAYYYYQRY